MNKVNYTHINHDKRLLIVDDHNNGLTNAQIGRKRCIHRSTIGRILKKCVDYEIKLVGNNWKRIEYYNVKRGDLIYELNRKRCIKKTKIHDDTNLTFYIKTMLRKYKSSPYDMIRKLDDKVLDLKTGKFLKQTYREFFNLGDISLSEKTIYNAINSNRVHDLKPWMKLYNYSHKYVFKEGKRLNGDSIDLIPKEMLERNTEGIWEGDTVVGKQGTKECLLTLTNRKNNDEIIIKIPNRTKPSVVNALNWLEQKLGWENFAEVFYIIIFDNGVEFRDVDGISMSCIKIGQKRTRVYYAHPYKSNDRAINENGNRMIRKFVPKSTDISTLTEFQIQIINMLINLTHRRRLDGLCSNSNGSIIAMSS